MAHGLTSWLKADFERDEQGNLLLDSFGRPMLDLDTDAEAAMQVVAEILIMHRSWLEAHRKKED